MVEGPPRLERAGDLQTLQLEQRTRRQRMQRGADDIRGDPLTGGLDVAEGNGHSLTDGNGNRETGNDGPGFPLPVSRFRSSAWFPPQVRLAGGADFIQSSHRGGVRRGPDDVGLILRLAGNGLHGIGELVERALALRL